MGRATATSPFSFGRRIIFTGTAVYLSTLVYTTKNSTIWPTMAFFIGCTVLPGVSDLLARWGAARDLDTGSRPGP
jgi:hypothetical protein